MAARSEAEALKATGSRIVLLFAVFHVFCGFSPAKAIDCERGKELRSRMISELDQKALGDFVARPVSFAISAYKHFFGPAKASACPMAPSCSTYASNAVERYGFFWGTLLGADRLHRCGHDLEYYPTVIIDSRLRYSDPVP